LPPFKLGLGDGKQRMSWVHIDDYVAMLLKLSHDAQASGPYNMTAPQPVTNAEFTSTLAKTLHRPAFFAALALLLKLAMGACLLLEGQKVLPGKMSASGYRFQFSYLSDALNNLLNKKT